MRHDGAAASCKYIISSSFISIPVFKLQWLYIITYVSVPIVWEDSVSNNGKGDQNWKKKKRQCALNIFSKLPFSF